MIPKRNTERENIGNIEKYLKNKIKSNQREPKRENSLGSTTTMLHGRNI